MRTGLLQKCYEARRLPKTLYIVPNACSIYSKIKLLPPKQYSGRSLISLWCELTHIAVTSILGDGLLSIYLLFSWKTELVNFWTCKYWFLHWNSAWFLHVFNYGWTSFTLYSCPSYVYEWAAYKVKNTKTAKYNKNI